MKVTISRSNMRDVLSKVQGITARKTNLAITETILMQTTEEGLSLVATDLETGFEGVYPAQVESEGTVAINARKLYEIVREFPTADVVLHEVENRWIEIGNENVEYHIVGMDPKDFPQTPRIEDVDFFDIDAIGLRRMIDRVSAVTGPPDDKRAHIRGVFFETVTDTDPMRARIVSTDGNRLSMSDHVYEPGVTVPPFGGILIPKKGIHEMAKFLDEEGKAQVGAKENHFIIRKGSEMITSRLLEGEYPPYRDIFSREGGTLIRIERDPFMMMLRRMSILASDAYKGVIFSFKEDRLVITATNPDIGESKEEIGLDYSGDPLEIGFNPRYFLESLNVIPDETVVLDIFGEKKPCLIRGDTDTTYMAVVMPMKI